MSTLVYPFFNPDHLRGHYLSDLSTAFTDETLSVVEDDWLKQVGSQAANLRVDRPTLPPDVRLDPALACAMVISRGHADHPAMYLWTVMDGLVPCADRTALNAELLRLQGDSTAIFELEHIDGDVFESLAKTYLLDRASHLQAVAQWFAALPDLDSQLQAQLAPHLATLFPDQPSDPHNAWVQVTNADGTQVLRTLSLAELHLCTMAGQALDQGERLRWLRADGSVMSDSERTTLQAAMADSKATVADRFTEALDKHWAPQRQSIANLYRGGFYQALLQARANGTVPHDHWPWLRTALADGRIEPVALGETGSPEPTLNVAGAFLIRHPHADLVYAYDGLSELQRHINRQSLALYLADLPAPPLGVALDDGTRWGQLQHPMLRPIKPAEDPFLACVDDIARCQLRNLRNCLQFDAGTAARAMVQVDDALDVRNLIDLRLVSQDPARRWNAVPLLNQTALRPKPGALPDTAQWLKHLNALSNQFKALNGGVADIGDSIASVLDPAISVVDALLDSSAVTFSFDQTGAQEPAKVNLGDLLLERFSQPTQRPATLPAPRDSEGAIIPGLTAPLAQALLADATPRLEPHFKKILASERGWRLQGLWKWPQRNAAALREQMLRLELAMQRAYGRLDKSDLDRLQQVLDYPLDSQRRTLPNATRAYGLAIRFGDRKVAVLSNTFMLQARQNAQGPLLFWSALYGLRDFTTVTGLLSWLDECLRTAPSNEPWLGLLPPADQEALLNALAHDPATAITINTWPISLPLTVQLQRHEWLRQQAVATTAFQLARDFHFEGALLRRYVHACSAADVMNVHFQGLSNALQYCHLTAILPKWLSSATVDDLKAYVALLSTCVRLQHPENDFLFGITDLKQFAHLRVSERLRKDFGATAPDPDAVLITLRQFQGMPIRLGEIPSHLAAATQVYRETLSTAAVDQLALTPGIPAIVEMADASQPPVGLTPAYVNSMIASLDIAKQYRDVLAQKFAVDEPDYLERQLRFSRQQAAELLAAAFQQKMSKTLTNTAYRYVENVVSMPDALAREPVDSVDVVIRPLQFLAASFLLPDTATGMHLIGPKDISQGPLVLYTVHTKGDLFREYRNGDDLLDKLRQDTALQAQIIEHLDPAISERYARGGFRIPHLPSAGESILDVELRPVGTTLVPSTPATGHALHYLFKDNLALLQAIAKTTTITTAEARWKRFLYWITLVLEQGANLLPGPIAELLGLWQSQTWFQASFSAASNRHWGEALGEFTAALSLMGGSRHTAQRMVGAGKGSLPYTSRQPTPGTSASIATARAERLSPFEAQNVSLHAMKRHPEQHLYTLGAQRYAVVDGKVYQVREVQGQWHVYEGERKGPAVEWHAGTQWRLSDTTPLPRRGLSITRILDQRGTDKQVSKVLDVRSRGMSELFITDPLKAQQINSAYFQAQTYLLNALRNLNVRHPERPLPARTEALLATTFGVATTTPRLLNQVRRCLEQVLSHLSDRSLEPLNSKRYITGDNRSGYDRTIGFVYRHDPQQRIFLTERFFRVETEVLLAVDPTLTLIDPLVHHQAGTLIHEVSHLAVDSADIAYLNSTLPYPDMLLNHTPSQKAFVDGLAKRRTGLSLQTPSQELFTVEDRQTGVVRDLDLEDGKSMDVVLKITGTADLDVARDVFNTDPDKRAQIILANADSITLLTTLLGRERF